MKRVIKSILKVVVYFFLILAAAIFLEEFLDINGWLILFVGFIIFIGYLLQKRLRNRSCDEGRTFRSIVREPHIPKKVSHASAHFSRSHSGRHRRFVILLPASVILLFAVSLLIWQKVRVTTPQSLIEFAEKYPEASEYVSEYKAYYKVPVDYEMHLEFTDGEIPLFIQWDRRWGYDTYGGGWIGNNGCGPTCVSMVVCGLTGSDEWNPARVARFSEGNGYYVSGIGSSWELMSKGVEELGLRSTEGEVSVDYIKRNVSAVSPLVCSMTPGNFTYTGHFIVLTGVDADGNILVNDPNSPANSAKHWDPDLLVSQMAAVWKIEL